MKLPGSLLVPHAALSFLCAAVVAHAAETSAYGQRNEVFSTAAIQPAASARPTEIIALPAPRARPLRTIATTPAGERSAALHVADVQPKRMLTPAVRPLRDRRSARDLATRPALRFPAGSALRQPPRVAKYQQGLSAPSNGVWIGRTPMVPRKGPAQLNRFIFRRDVAGTPVALPGAVPAGTNALSLDR